MPRTHTPTPDSTALTTDPAGADKARGPAKGPASVKSNGPAMSDALRAAQGGARSSLNTASSASGYQRLVRNYDEMRKESLYTNRVSGVLVSGASLTPRLQEDGTVQVQTSEHYTAKWESLKAEGLRGTVEHLIRERDPKKIGEALALAVDLPLARALQAANRELEPSSVKQNEATRTAKEFMALNAVSPMGDPTTGRPVFSQVWLDNGSGGQMPVYGFKKQERTPSGPQTSYLGLRPGLDQEGGRSVELVKGVVFNPGVTERGSRHITREAQIEGGPISIETAIDQQKFLAEMEAGGWSPINTAPPENADLPVKYRGMSEVDVSTRAILAIGKAAREKDVVMEGYRVALEGAAEPKNLTALEKGLISDYRHLAERLVNEGGLKKEGVKALFEQMDKTTKALGNLEATVESLRRNPAAMDPITEFRVIATDLLKGKEQKASEIFRYFDSPEDSFRAAVGEKAVGEFNASDNIRKAVLEQLAKDLTRELAPDRMGKEVWVNEKGKELAFPDGSPRVSTPFDEALARGGQHFDQVREAYYGLVQASMDTSANYTAIRLVLASRTSPTAALSNKEARELAGAYANLQINGTEMEAADKARVERTLAAAGPATAYLDEVMRTHTHLPLVAAHRAGLSPAEFQRAMLANAQDVEPWSVAAKSYRVYSYNSVPVPSSAALYIVPEQDLPQDLDILDAGKLEEATASRTWRIVSLANEDGRPTPVIQQMGLSTAAMLDARLEANQKNIPVLMSRKPLSENLPLGAALAKTYNLPIVETADPIDGTRGRYAAVGMKVTGTPIASTVTPGYYKALTFSNAPLVDKVEPIQLADEGDFAASFGLDRAKKLLEGPKNKAHLAALADMSRPERANGVYKVTMTPAGIQGFATQRKAAVNAMAAARSAGATLEFATKSKSLPPDARGALKATETSTLAGIKAGAESKVVEAAVLAKKLEDFAAKGSGRQGYTGFAPPLGAGNPAVRIRKPPIELRFAGDFSSLEEVKPRLNKQGLSVHLDAYLIEG